MMGFRIKYFKTYIDLIDCLNKNLIRPNSIVSITEDAKSNVIVLIYYGVKDLK